MRLSFWLWQVYFMEMARTRRGVLFSKEKQLTELKKQNKAQLDHVRQSSDMKGP